MQSRSNELTRPAWYKKTKEWAYCKLDRHVMLVTLHLPTLDSRDLELAQVIPSFEFLVISRESEVRLLGVSVIGSEAGYSTKVPPDSLSQVAKDVLE